MIPIYRTDSYQTEILTTVDSVVDDDEFQLLSFRETIFCEGGGQPVDYGTVTCHDQVRAIHGLVKHKGDTRVKIPVIEGLSKGANASCKIDFDRRFRMMRLHSAQHAFAGAVRSLVSGYETGGMQIDLDACSCTMLFSSASPVDSAVIKDATEIFSRISQEGRLVHAEQYASVEEAQAKFGQLFRPSDPKVMLKGRVRVIVIEGLDVNACGGTHVRNLKEAAGVKMQEFKVLPSGYALTLRTES